MRFEWDEEKNALNLRKHGVDFLSASRVFYDPNLVLEKDRVDEKTGEQRWHVTGQAQGNTGRAALLLVVHVYRSKNGEEIIRILSAREADKRERRRRYQ